MSSQTYLKSYKQKNTHQPNFFLLTVLWYSCMASSYAVKYQEQTGLNYKIIFTHLYRQTQNETQKQTLFFLLTVFWYSCIASSYAEKYQQQTGLHKKNFIFIYLYKQPQTQRPILLAESVMVFMHGIISYAENYQKQTGLKKTIYFYT